MSLKTKNASSIATSSSLSSAPSSQFTHYPPRPSPLATIIFAALASSLGPSPGTRSSLNTTVSITTLRGRDLTSRAGPEPSRRPGDTSRAESELNGLRLGSTRIVGGAVIPSTSPIGTLRCSGVRKGLRRNANRIYAVEFCVASKVA